jgi:radical SAM superfamily enzyme
MEDFNIKDYLRPSGYEDKVREQIEKEINLIYHVMVLYMNYTRFEITREEFQEQLANILTHSVVNKNIELDPDSYPDEVMDKVLNYSKIEDFYKDDVDITVLQESKRLFKKKLKELNAINEFS